MLLSVSSHITIRHDLRPGDLGRIVSLHGEAYEPLGGYGLRFEAYVARTVAEYVLDNLFTTDGLPESQALYEKLGFHVTSNEIEELWDGERPLIRMQLDLGDTTDDPAL